MQAWGCDGTSKMTVKLSKLKLGKNDNPKDPNNDIAAIENQYRCQIDEKTQKALVVKAAGKYYADIIRQETLKKGTGVTAEDLIQAMSDTYRIDSGVKEDSHDDDKHVNETALVTGTFPYKCYNCEVSKVTEHKKFRKRRKNEQQGRSAESAENMASVDTQRRILGKIK